MEDGRVSSVGTRTVLFTDVTDSTMLRASLGDAAADRLDRTLHRLQEGAIKANRGTVVKTLGDGVMATFDSASQAIGAAIEIQARVHDHNERNPPAIGLRIGISTGDVSTTADGDHLGTPVVEAARLCAAARSGRILIADVVKMLAGSRMTDDLVDLGPQEYKGLAAPLRTWEVQWEAAPVTEALLPSPLQFDDGFPFVGRGVERQRLDEAWARALAGHLGLVLIAGEPGAGKTRLAAEFAREALATGALVLFGSCDEGLGVPQQPFVACLRQLLAAPGRPRLGPHAGELARLVPEIAERVPSLPPPLKSDPETERYQLFNAFVEMLDDVAEEGPLVVVIDDLHWATAPTLQLLRHLVRSRLSAPVLLVATYRNTDVDGNQPFTEALADFRRSESVTQVELTGLEPRSVRTYLEGIAGYELDARADALAARLHAETDGNPFFMREVLLHLVETGHLYLLDGRWETDATYLDAVPAGARDVITQRLVRLGEEARALLARAAVVGAEFTLGTLARIVELDDDAIFDSLERASSARLVQEVDVDHYRFTHALVRSALLDGLSVSRRARLHRQVAEALEDQAESPHRTVEDLAEHWLAAGDAGDPAKAIHYLRLSARQAAEHLAHDEAVSLLQSAVDLARRHEVDDRTMAELLTELGAAQVRAGVSGSRATLIDATRLAHRIGATDLLVAAVLSNVRTAAVLDLDPERVELLELALQAIDDDPWPERARLLASLGFELSFTRDRDRWTALSDDALTLAREGGNLADLAYVLSMRVNAFRGPDTLFQRLEACAEIEAISAELDDPAMQFLASYRRAQVLMEAGDIPDLRAVVATMAALTERLGQPLMAWNTARRQAELALLDGDIDRALRLSSEVRKIGLDLHLPNGEPIYAGLAAKIFVVAGQPERAAQLYGEWVDRVHLIGYRFGMALGLFLAGRRDEAVEQWERGASQGLAGLDRDPYWLESIGLAAEVACYLDDRSRSAVIAEELLPHGHHIISVGVGALCSSDHAIGVALLGAGDLDRAVTWLRSAIEHGRAVGAPLLAASSQVRLAEALLRRRGSDDEQEGHNLLAMAHATAVQHEAQGIVDAARRVEDKDGQAS